MAGFDDLIDDDPAALGIYFVRKSGTSFIEWATLVDDDLNNVDVTTGYTVAAKFYDSNGTVVGHTYTTGTSGTYGLWVTLGNGEVAINATPAGLTTEFGSYLDRNLRFNVIVTRTADGAAFAAFANCYLKVESP